jgi:hypothetical protein
MKSLPFTIPGLWFHRKSLGKGPTDNQRLEPSDKNDTYVPAFCFLNAKSISKVFMLFYCSLYKYIPRINCFWLTLSPTASLGLCFLGLDQVLWFLYLIKAKRGWSIFQFYFHQKCVCQNRVTSEALLLQGLQQWFPESDFTRILCTTLHSQHHSSLIRYVLSWSQ